MKKNYSIPEDLTWECKVFATKQVFIPKEIQEKLGTSLKPGVKLRLGVISIIEESKKEIPAETLKTDKVEDKK